MASSARIDELRKKFEENPRRYFAPLANEYRKAGDIDQAISICREYLPQQPGHMSGHIVYGQALYEARQYEEAKTVFETALGLDPENLIALRHLGDIALILGDTDGARTWYGRVLEADPRNEEIQAQLKSLDTLVATAPTPLSTAAVDAGTAETVEGTPPALELTTPTTIPSFPAQDPTAAPAHPPSSSAPTVIVKAMPMPAVERTIEQPAMEVPHPGAESLSTTPTAEVTLEKLPEPAMPDLGNLTTGGGPRSTIEVEKTLGFEPTAAASDDASLTQPETTQPPGLETTAQGTGETPPIDSFTLDGLETTSMVPMDSPAPAEPETPPAGEPAQFSELPAEGEPSIELGGAPAPAEDAAPTPGQPTPAGDFDLVPSPPVDAFAPPAAEPAPPIESAAIDTPAAESGLAQATPQATPAAEPPAEERSQELPFLDLGEGAPSAAVEAVNAAAPPEPPMAESKPFVTETMAELYEQQGHRAEALRVYRALLEQRPGDAHLRERIEKLEDRRGPTIRELLARVAARRPSASSASSSAAAAAETPMERRAPAPSAPTEAPAPEVAAAPVAPRPPEAADTHGAAAERPPVTRRPDALGGLFGSAAVSEVDERAALTLAAAFSSARRENGSSGGGFPGSPARPASKDLSLDAVFGAEPGSAPPASSFSFDQFFSERATSEHPAAGNRGATPGPETRDDIAKFTEWLEGLKQR